MKRSDVSQVDGIGDYVAALIRHAFDVADRHDLTVQLGVPTFHGTDPDSHLSLAISRALPAATDDPRLDRPVGEWAPQDPIRMYFDRRIVGSDHHTLCIAEVDAATPADIDVAVAVGLTQWSPERVEHDPRSEWNRHRRALARERRYEREAEHDDESDFDDRYFWWDAVSWDEARQAHVIDDSPTHLPEWVRDRWPLRVLDDTAPAVTAPCHGIVIRTDGNRLVLTEPLTRSSAGEALGAVAVSNVTALWPDAPDGTLVVYVDGNRDERQLAPNRAATVICNTEATVDGDVVVGSTHPGRALPESVARDLLTLGDLLNPPHPATARPDPNHDPLATPPSSTRLGDSASIGPGPGRQFDHGATPNVAVSLTDVPSPAAPSCPSGGGHSAVGEPGRAVVSDGVPGRSAALSTRWWRPRGSSRGRSL